jgi:hypothetical protein
MKALKFKLEIKFKTFSIYLTFDNSFDAMNKLKELEQEYGKAESWNLERFEV